MKQKYANDKNYKIINDTVIKTWKQYIFKQAKK